MIPKPVNGKLSAEDRGKVAQWIDGYECGIKHTDRLRNNTWLLMIMTFIAGFLLGVSL